MKIGFLVECGPEGAETRVISHLAKMINRKVEADIIPLGNKPNLKRQCGEYAKTLLDRGCNRVLIVWDLLSDWQEYEGKGCRHDDKEEICQSLSAVGLHRNDKRVRLHCIEKMLEAWIIADERALGKFLSTAAHPVSVPRNRRPEQISDPKAALTTLFKKYGGRVRQYVDRQHAIRIAERLPDLTRLRKLESFRHFETKLTS